MARSFKVEVIADSSGKWCSNGHRYASKDEGERAAFDLFQRWTLVTEYRVSESDEPVNAKWVDGKGTEAVP